MKPSGHQDMFYYRSGRDSKVSAWKAIQMSYHQKLGAVINLSSIQQKKRSIIKS